METMEAEGGCAERHTDICLPSSAEHRRKTKELGEAFEGKEKTHVSTGPSTGELPEPGEQGAEDHRSTYWWGVKVECTEEFR